MKNNEVINRHKKRWYEGESQSDENLNQAIENFNSLVDNFEAPSVHRIQYTLPLNYRTDIQFDENVVISDASRYEQIKDLKLMHIKLTSEISSGSLVYWQDDWWLVSNEEHNSVVSHRTYILIRCGITINIKYNGVVYNYPIAINNLTMYSDGSKELVNLTVSSAKYSIQIPENEITNSIDVGTRFLIRERAFEVSLIDDFTIDNIRTFTVCETVLNSLDDIENNIAYNPNSDLEGVVNPNLKISGEDIILLGDTLEYVLYGTNAWEITYNDMVEIISNNPGKCKIKCNVDNSYIGQTVKLMACDRNGNIIDTKKITIGGLF